MKLHSEGNHVRQLYHFAQCFSAHDRDPVARALEMSLKSQVSVKNRVVGGSKATHTSFLCAQLELHPTPPVASCVS